MCRKSRCHWPMHLGCGLFSLAEYLKISDSKPKLGSDRDYRKETQSDEFGRSGSDPITICCSFLVRRPSEDAINRSDRRQPSPTNPFWHPMGGDHGNGMGRCPAVRIWGRFQQTEINKPVSRCAVCSEFDRRFKSPKCRNTVYQRKDQMQKTKSCA